MRFFRGFFTITLYETEENKEKTFTPWSTQNEKQRAHHFLRVVWEDTEAKDVKIRMRRRRCLHSDLYKQMDHFPVILKDTEATDVADCTPCWFMLLIIVIVNVMVICYKGCMHVMLVRVPKLASRPK